MTELEKVTEEGAQSYFIHKGRFVCPYAWETPEFNHFQRGWIQSQKRDPNPVKAVLHRAPWDYTQAASLPPERYNAYADLKGRSKPRK